MQYNHFPKNFLSQIIDKGEILREYPVDESQSVSNAGDAIVYKYVNGVEFEVITWNERAMEHEPGSITVTNLSED